jgi:hypothetical protein
MERRDQFLLLLALGGAGYAIHSNWDTIALKLSFSELSPGRIKSMELARDSSNFQEGATNWQYMQTASKQGRIRLAPEPWTSDLIRGEEFHVIARWYDVEDDTNVAYGFRVDTAKRTVFYEGQIPVPATPR